MRRALLILPLIPLLAMACASTDWEARYGEMEEQARSLQAENDQLRQALAAGDTDDTASREQIAQAEQALQALSSELAALKNRPAPPSPAEEELALLQQELQRLRQKYDNVNLTPEGNIEITLNSDVSFGSGSRKLTTEGRKTLDSVAATLQTEFAGHLVRVIGHTDTDPIKKSPYQDNWELGAERALEVTRYFSTSHGIDESRLVAASRGATSPVSDNSTKEGRAANRRVEIVVVIPRRQIVGDGDF